MSQSSKSYSIGVDLGGTEIKAGLVLSTGKVIDNLSKPSQANDGASIVSGNIASAIHQLIRTNPQLSPEDLVGIGIGMHRGEGPQQGQPRIEGIFETSFEGKILFQNTLLN